MARQPRAPLDFPIKEVFGYPPSPTTYDGVQSQAERNCPFAGNKCEKFRQYRAGYCSVTYAAEGDRGQRRTYAVCDHRLDGPPIRAVLRDYFGGHAYTRVASEIVLRNPRIVFDYVAFTEDLYGISDAVAIETQAIDLRGGGVGPAFRAWMDGRPSEWRRYFTDEAEQTGRPDTVSYGVNMGNIYKRLGLQAAEKGTFLKSIGVPLYVVMQDLPFLYLRDRIRFPEAESSWDITFLTFDYTGNLESDGKLEFRHQRTVRTSLEGFVEALAANNRAGDNLREQFLQQVLRKANAPPNQPPR